MAVAQFQDASPLDPSFFGEPQSPVFRRWGDKKERPSTGASSLLQIWRELEGERAVSHSMKQRSNGSDYSCSSSLTSVGKSCDNRDDISEDSDECQNRSDCAEHEDNSSVISEQSSNLGDTGRERVRQVFREWKNNGIKSHPPNGLLVDKRSGTQCLGENEIGRVRMIREWVETNLGQSNCCSPRDGVPVTHSQFDLVNPGIGCEQKSIRRLFGRQTLVDLLFRARCERKIELQCLLEQKTVSDFAHRNRIQALLKGRFLRNDRLVPNEKQHCVAAIELSLLRQRSTVSDLREGFLSRLDNSTLNSTNVAVSDSFLIKESNGQADAICREMKVESNCSASCWESVSDDSQSLLEFDVHVTEVEKPILERNGNIEEQIILCVDVDRQEDVILESKESEQLTAEITSVDYRFDEQNNSSVCNYWSLESDEMNSNEPLDVFHRRDQSQGEASVVYEVNNYTKNKEENVNGEFHLEDASIPLEEVQESVIEIDDSSAQVLDSASFTDSEDGGRDDTAISWLEDSADTWFQEASVNDTISSWFMPSVTVGASAEAINSLYFPDDDNVSHMELRELFSRRRVTSLLQSSFRESLNQVLRSHVERLGHVSNDWEEDNITSIPILIEQERIHNGDQILDDEEEPDRIRPSPTNHNSETEWEVINALRIDMRKLQQRMNDMQSMLEACMDLQIELQRSMQQEVSATLNPSFFPTDAPEQNLLHDESQWNYMKKGICCLCRDNTIDSLLYRCGHICTCLRCAKKLIQETGKCPICQVPVAEAVRADFNICKRVKARRVLHELSESNAVCQTIAY